MQFFVDFIFFIDFNRARFTLQSEKEFRLFDCTAIIIVKCVYIYKCVCLYVLNLWDLL